MVEKSTKAARGTVQCENTNINLLKANDFVADIIKKEMANKGTLLINITSSAGSGKTTLMQKTAQKLKDKTGIQALQIVTGGICHLEAQMVHQVLDQFDLESIDLLFIENVGNLVCPSSFDLGEDYRVTLMATTEGDDKPKKYPKMFLTSDMMLVSKADLLPYVPFSVEAVTKDAREVNHELEVLQISALSEEGIDEWCEWLLAKIKQKKDNA